MATPRKKPEDKLKTGRKSDYREEYCAKVVELGKLGKSKAQIARALDKNRDTLYGWAEEHPEFSGALKNAHEAALSWWEDLGSNLADGNCRNGNATAFIFQMKNRFRDDYFDRLEHTGQGGGPVQVSFTRADEAL